MLDWHSPPEAQNESAPSYSFAQTIAVIAIGALILLLPAILAGRPFVYWDTPTFYGWGHDIVAAIRNPWPPLSDFPVHRGLWAADNYPGAWDQIDARRFQLVMTSIGARSSFYAVPFFLLGSALSLWAPAALQALIAAWLLWLTCVATLPLLYAQTFLGLIAALTLLTAAPFFVAFLMPDIFAAFAVLATCLLVSCYDRLTRWQRMSCAVILAGSIVVHLSILPMVAMLLLANGVAVRILVPVTAHWRGASIVVIALACAGVASFASGVGLKAVFGQTVQPPPFLEGRVIADGPGQQFLRETCGSKRWAACLWENARVRNTDDIIWPDVTWHNLPLITDPAERQRFLDQQPNLVIGTLIHHPLAQLLASARNAALQLAKFTIAYDVGGSLTGLLNVHTDRTMRVIQIVPNMGPCVVDPNRACDQTHILKYLQLVQYGAVLGALLFLGLYGAHWIKSFASARRTAVEGQRIAFAASILAGVVLNGIVCGALSGPWGRYQARVVWLVPLAALILLEALRQRHSTRATLHNAVPRGLAGPRHARLGPPPQ